MSINDTNRENLSHGETLSMLIAVEATMLSGVATAFLISYKLFFTVRRILRSRRAVRVVKTPSDACDSSLFMSLLAGELLRSIAASMMLRWVLERVVFPDGSTQEVVNDPFCRAQGYLKLFSTNLIDFTTLGITIHTFTVLVLRWTGPRFRYMVKYLTAGVWTIAVLITSITYAVHPKDLMGPTGHWCWISVSKVAQVMAEYLWMWLIGVITAVLYGIGFLVVRPGRRSNADDDAREMRRTANELLLYPVVYLVCITPQSFGRWFFFSGYHVPYQYTFFATTLFLLSGMFNAILFFSTRYHLLSGGLSTDAIDTATPSEHEMRAATMKSPAVAENLDGRVPMNLYRGSGDFHGYYVHEGGMGESSTARDSTASAQRVPHMDDGEEDFGRAPL
ncbi:hypothetical protein BKA70DRAFT_1399210 [Coprinopsis sp. MPI-PUGE-AT-0042]|nr:hypothetical protein BKA70DRAFT_1399210 [Coprinopsis sp. MPI-PUGE-AT-0042]